jgi:hypothetical protein
VESHEIDRKVFGSVADLATFVEKCRAALAPGSPNG